MLHVRVSFLNRPFIPKVEDMILPCFQYLLDLDEKCS